MKISPNKTLNLTECNYKLPNQSINLFECISKENEETSRWV